VTSVDDHLRVEVDGRVATVTLCRPEVLNALHSTTHRALAHALDVLDGDAEVGAVVLAGQGRAFCSGSDLREVGSLTGEASQRYVQLDFGTKNRLAGLTKPVVAAVQGHCVGGGLELALACDLRVAADDARFALPEVSLGSVPGSGGLQRLPAIVGLGIAKEWVFTGRVVRAAEAYQRGLVNRVVPREQLTAAAHDLAATLATHSPVALRLAKVALDPSPPPDRGLVATYQMLAGDVCHAQDRYAQATDRFTAAARRDGSG